MWLFKSAGVTDFSVSHLKYSYKWRFAQYFLNLWLDFFFSIFISALFTCIFLTDLSPMWRVLILSYVKVPGCKCRYIFFLFPVLVWKLFIFFKNGTYFKKLIKILYNGYCLWAACLRGMVTWNCTIDGTILLSM